MKKLLLLLPLLLLSCAKLPVQRHSVVVNTKEKVLNRPITRSERYFSCVVKLHQEGIAQSKLEKLCNATHGSIDL